MDFTRRQRNAVTNKVAYDDLEQQYPHKVMMYLIPPTQDIRLEEFEDMALERLRLLRIFEQANLKGLRLLSEDWKEYIHVELKREGLKGYARLCSSSTALSIGSETSSVANRNKWEAEMQARRRDYISHFILRLAYCRSEDLRRWFVTREMELFKIKFSTLSSPEIKSFLQLNKLNYTPITTEQKDAVKDGLYESTIGQSVAKIELLDFYKVPFTQVVDLVRSRRCFLKSGYAYVNTHDFVSIVAAMQQRYIEKGLEASQRFTEHIEVDERIVHLLKSLHTSYTGKDYALNKGAANSVPIEALDQLSRKSFPLCMRACHEHLRTHHHIKYTGRMQYCLFLKGIGVTVDDAVRFWRDEFTKKMDLEKFTKGGYEYNILHNYGKRGSMINYTPYSCLKIIQEPAQPGSVNGCPYKIYDGKTLRAKLSGNGLSHAAVEEVMSYVEKGHYQLACGKYFQITHETTTEIGINHPNQYFEESQVLMGNRVKKSQGSGAVRKGVKRNANGEGASILANLDDDDELWNVANTQAESHQSQQQKVPEPNSNFWGADDDMDLSTLQEIEN